MMEKVTGDRHRVREARRPPGDVVLQRQTQELGTDIRSGSSKETFQQSSAAPDNSTDEQHAASLSVYGGWYSLPPGAVMLRHSSAPTDRERRLGLHQELRPWHGVHPVQPSERSIGIFRTPAIVRTNSSMPTGFWM